jgi:hypothetical protein
MKTPMQQLIDRINDLKISCSDPDANWLADMLIRDISEGSKFDKSFLEMEKEQMGYTKQDVLKAGEMGEINHHDTEHIVSYLDEAKQYNETFNTNEK